MFDKAAMFTTGMTRGIIMDALQMCHCADISSTVTKTNICMYCSQNSLVVTSDRSRISLLGIQLRD